MMASDTSYSLLEKTGEGHSGKVMRDLQNPRLRTLSVRSDPMGRRDASALVKTQVLKSKSARMTFYFKNLTFRHFISFPGIFTSFKVFNIYFSTAGGNDGDPRHRTHSQIP